MARRIGLNPLAQLCRRAGTSLAAGIDARRFWQSESKRASGRQRAVLQEVSRAVAAGESTADALAAAGDYFPPSARELVAVGEDSGRLAEVFLRLAEHYEHLLKLRRLFLTGLVWPAWELAVAVVVVGLLILLMGVIGSRTGETIDLLGLGLTGTRGLMIYLAFVGGVAAAVAWLVVAWQRGWRAGRSMGWLAERAPALGHCLKMLGLARFTWSLAITLETGMDVRRAVALAITGSQYGPLLARRQAIDGRLKAGGDIHQALATAAGVLPEELLHTVAVGEESGRLSESLEVISKQYEQRTETASGAMTVVSTYLIWGLVGLVIIAVILRLMMFYVGTIYQYL